MALIGLKIPDNVSEMLRNIEVDGERDQSDHLTMFYFKDSLSVKDIAKICKALSPILEKIKPLECSVKEINCFPKGPDGVPIKAEIDSKDLIKLRKQIAKAFDDEKILFSKDHPDFKPHVTLSYNDEEIKKMKLLSPIKWVANKIILWGGETSTNGINLDIPFSSKITKADLILGVADKIKRGL